MAARALALLACISTASCVTQNVHFEPPANYPPSIETPEALGARHPLGTIIGLNEALSGTDGGVGAGDTVHLIVEVRDPNVDERLNYKVFLDFEPGLDPVPQEIAAGTIPGQDGSLTRTLEIDLAPTIFTGNRCHRLELFIAGEQGFQPAPSQRRPNLNGDLATATWFVIDDRGMVEVSTEACRAWI